MPTVSGLVPDWNDFADWRGVSAANRFVTMSPDGRRAVPADSIPYANEGDAPPVRYGIPGSARVPASHAGEGFGVPVRCDGPRSSASWPPPLGGVLRHPGPLA